jgi:hypothetical protein
LGWRKKQFEIKKIINGVERESISHEVDHARTFENGKIVALEIEWNNKDPFSIEILKILSACMQKEL